MAAINSAAVSVDWGETTLHVVGLNVDPTHAPLVEGLRQGLIDRVATDHAPHTDEEKLGGSLDQTLAGSPGVETLYLSCLELARREPVIGI